VLGRAETFASKNSALPAAVDGFMMGLGFTAVLICVGAARELLGTGVIFSNMQLLFGAQAAGWSLDIFGSDYPGMILALLPPGAFIIVGFLMAAKNYIDHIVKQKAATNSVAEPSLKGGKRVRTTGPVA
jgi:electron transport complex protein RnfE